MRISCADEALDATRDFHDASHSQSSGSFETRVQKMPCFGDAAVQALMTLDAPDVSDADAALAATR